MLQRCWVCPHLSSFINFLQKKAQNGHFKIHHYRSLQGQFYIPTTALWRHVKICNHEIKLTDSSFKPTVCYCKACSGQVMTLSHEQLRSPVSRGILTFASNVLQNCKTSLEIISVLCISISIRFWIFRPADLGKAKCL